MSEVTGNLVSFFRVYGPSRFQTAAGKPLGRRALQKKILEFALPIIRVTKGDPLIDPAEGDAMLMRHAQFRSVSRRGPRTP